MVFYLIRPPIKGKEGGSGGSSKQQTRRKRSAGGNQIGTERIV